MPEKMRSYAGPSTMLKPDAATINAFLSWWFSACNRGMIEIAWKTTKSNKLSNVQHFRLHDPAIGPFVARINAMEGADCYFGASTVEPRPLHENGYVQRSTDQNVVQSPGAWVDQDEWEHVRHTDQSPPAFQPHSMVVTGMTPHLRRQLWFKASEPFTEPKKVRSYNSRLNKLYMSDGSVVNPSRLMRLPGTIAWPWKGGGRVPELTTWHPPQNMNLAYAKNVFETALPFDAPETTKNESIENNHAGLKVSDLLHKIKSGDQWHNNIVKLLAHWTGRGWSDEEMLGYAEQFTLDGYEVEDTEDQMRVIIDGARGKWDIPSVDPVARTRIDEARAAFEKFGLAPASTPLPTTEAAPPMAPLLSLGQLNKNFGQKPSFVIDGVLARNATVLLSGLPGAGKSPLVQSMAACLALGKPWGGFDCVQSRVIYVAGESRNQTAINIPLFGAQILSKEFGGGYKPVDAIELINDWILTLAENFLLETDSDKLIQQIHLECTTGRWAGHVPDVMILDTLRAISVGSISKDEDMIAVQAVLQKIRTAFPNLTIVLLTHSPKGDPEASSGTNRLEAMSEIIMNVAWVPAGSAPDDDKLSKKAEVIGPDIDGWHYTPFRLSMLRNKMWQPLRPQRMTLAVRQDEIKLLFGSEGLEREKKLKPVEQSKNPAGSPVIGTSIPPQEDEKAAFAAVKTLPKEEADKLAIDYFIRRIRVLGANGATQTEIMSYISEAPAEMQEAIGMAGKTPEDMRRTSYRYLKILNDRGEIEPVGRGRSAFWRLVGFKQSTGYKGFNDTANSAD